MKYTVIAGDTLAAIARRFAVGIADIANRNNIADVDLIRTGQVLDIPVAPAAGPVTINNADGSIEEFTVTATRPQPVVAGLNLGDWLKPPKLYYLLAGVAVLAYLNTKGRRK